MKKINEENSKTIIAVNNDNKKKIKRLKQSNTLSVD